MTRRSTIAVVTIFFLLLTGSCFGQETPKRPWNKAWILSMLAVTAANILDARSSMGKQEANPLLQNSQGTFSGTRGFLFKSAAVGSVMALETYMVHRNPNAAKSSAIVNFASAGVLTGISFRNSQVK